MKHAASPSGDPMFAFLDGRATTIRGISGTLRHTILPNCIYPYPHTAESLAFVPDARGKRTHAYREIRERLGDDWSTDLTNDIATYCQLAHAFGYRSEGE